MSDPTAPLNESVWVREFNESELRKHYADYLERCGLLHAALPFTAWADAEGFSALLRAQRRTGNRSLPRRAPPTRRGNEQI